MTIVEALTQSKARFDSGELELCGLHGEKKVAPSYMRRAGGGGSVRWDPQWLYKLRGVDLLASDWAPNNFPTVQC